MIPLEVTATLRGPILRAETIALDGLLAAAVAQDRCMPPLCAIDAGATRENDLLIRAHLPLELEPGGRFHLASTGEGGYEPGGFEGRHQNRRFPTTEAARWGKARLRRIDVSSGASKTYRIPYQVGHLKDDQMVFWALGEEAEVRRLLAGITHLGKKRSQGLGLVSRWSVRPCAPWEGFPVLREGRPLRPLPPDWPGLREWSESYSTLTFPYWDKSHETLCAVGF